MMMLRVISDLCQVYAEAVIPPTDKVCLWLGANVMLEYTLDGEWALHRALLSYLHFRR